MVHSAPGQLNCRLRLRLTLSLLCKSTNNIKRDERGETLLLTETWKISLLYFLDLFLFCFTRRRGSTGRTVWGARTGRTGRRGARWRQLGRTGVQMMTQNRRRVAGRRSRRISRFAVVIMTGQRATQWVETATRRQHRRRSSASSQLNKQQ